MSGYKVSCTVASKDGKGGCKFNVLTPSGKKSSLDGKSKSALAKKGIRTTAQLDAMEQRARERAIRTGVTEGRKQVIGKLWKERDCSADDYNIDCVLKPDGKCQLYCNKNKTSLKKILDMAGDDKRKRAGLRRAVRAATDNATKEAVYKGSYILRGSKPAKKTQHKGFAKLNPFFKFSQAMHELGAVEHIGSGRSKASERSKYLASIYKNVPSLKDSLEKANTIEKAKEIIQSGVQMGKLPKAAPLQQQLPKPTFLALPAPSGQQRLAITGSKERLALPAPPGQALKSTQRSAKKAQPGAKVGGGFGGMSSAASGPGLSGGSEVDEELLRCREFMCENGITDNNLYRQFVKNHMSEFKDTSNPAAQELFKLLNSCKTKGVYCEALSIVQSFLKNLVQDLQKGAYHESDIPMRLMEVYVLELLQNNVNMYETPTTNSGETTSWLDLGANIIPDMIFKKLKIEKSDPAWKCFSDTSNIDKAKTRVDCMLNIFAATKRKSQDDIIQSLRALFKKYNISIVSYTPFIRALGKMKLCGNPNRLDNETYRLFSATDKELWKEARGIESIAEETGGYTSLQEEKLRQLVLETIGLRKLICTYMVNPPVDKKGQEADSLPNALRTRLFSSVNPLRSFSQQFAESNANLGHVVTESPEQSMAILAEDDNVEMVMKTFFKNAGALANFWRVVEDRTRAGYTWKQKQKQKKD